MREKRERERRVFPLLRFSFFSHWMEIPEEKRSERYFGSASFFFLIISTDGLRIIVPIALHNEQRLDWRKERDKERCLFLSLSRQRPKEEGEIEIFFLLRREKNHCEHERDGEEEEREKKGKEERKKESIRIGHVMKVYMCTQYSTNIAVLIVHCSYSVEISL